MIKDKERIVRRHERVALQITNSKLYIRCIKDILKKYPEIYHEYIFYYYSNDWSPIRPIPQYIVEHIRIFGGEVCIRFNYIKHNDYYVQSEEQQKE